MLFNFRTRRKNLSSQKQQEMGKYLQKQRSNSVSSVTWRNIQYCYVDLIS